ncbi:MAG: hypothetical protein WBH57_03110 [Anaerolineae bacterium]
MESRLYPEAIKKGAETLLGFDFLSQPKDGLTENGWKTNWVVGGWRRVSTGGCRWI